MSKLFAFVFAMTLFGAHQAQALPLADANTRFLQANFTADPGNYNYEGIVALDDCSGSIIQFENAKDTDLALVLTNGHCYEGGFITAGTVLTNVESSRGFDVLDPQANVIGSLTATKVLFATMTKTDITLYQTNQTYAEIKANFNVRPFVLASNHPMAGQKLELISGYWREGYQCSIDGFVNEMHESDWSWVDSIRFTHDGCHTRGGTSGSPLIAAGTRTVIGINNTGNESGRKCTLNNPCEIDASGNITYQKGNSYGEQTFWIYSCLTADNQIDLSKQGCLLPH
jgi:V8-like Glu-specific endopeptidase